MRKSLPIVVKNEPNPNPANDPGCSGYRCRRFRRPHRGGAEAHALDLAAVRKIQIYTTPAILTEYEEVLRRSKFSRISLKVIDGALELIRRLAILVNPEETLAVSSDESDNRFLECAVAAEADYLVTGNKRHFPAQWKKCGHRCTWNSWSCS